MKKELKTEEERIAYNCRKATLLIEKKQSIELTSTEKMELQLHLAACYICRVYEQQSMLINAMMENILNATSREVKLDDGYKKHLKKTIADKMSHN